MLLSVSITDQRLVITLSCFSKKKKKLSLSFVFSLLYDKLCDIYWPRRLSLLDFSVFNYSPAAHNLVAVNKVGYNTCTTPRGSKVYKTGKDQIKLVKGQNFFICSIAGHCQSGMKVAVTAI